MENWVNWAVLILGGLANALAVLKGIKYFGDRMYAFHKEAMAEAVAIHRADAALTEGRFVKLEHGFEKLKLDQDETRGQLHEIKDMIAEVREALFSMLKK